ncbi:MAG: hypothetical protein Ta2A_20500 [Treponemataceae bacterium]|nr:MAG: hypothetical protein Ta2A_20500 [Treponemataceae bacterium]
MTQDDITKRLKEFGLFFAVFASLAIIAFTLAAFARPFWEKGLREKVALGIEKLFDKRYAVKDTVYLPFSFSSSALAFQLESTDGGVADMRGAQYGIIVRMSTGYGAVCAVFYYAPQNIGGAALGAQETATFADFVDTSARVEERMRHAPMGAQISFWEREIPKLFFRKNAQQGE